MSTARAFAAMLLALAVSLCVLAPVTYAQNLPKRELVITGGSFITDAYIDVGALTPPVFELDDREWIGTPHMSVMCYAPSVPKDEFTMYSHMEDVVYPVIWYYPLKHNLGAWKYEYGDQLTCELWECDGAPDGCSPKRPTALPNPKAGDDLLGRATLDMSNFDMLASHLLNFTVPADGKGTAGDDAGAFLIQCKGCRETWERDPNYVNPYAQYKPDIGVDPTSPSYPNPTVPPTDPISDDSGSLPWRPTPLPTPSPGPSTTQPVDVTNPSLPWRDGNEPVAPFDGPEQTDASGAGATEAESGGSGGSNTLVIVAAVIGGLVGALILAVATYFILRKCRYRAVEPEDVEQSEKDDAVARHLRIRVARPAEAEAAIHAAKGDAAMAELPWVPQTKH